MKDRIVRLVAVKGMLLLGASLALAEDPIALLEADPSMHTRPANTEILDDGFRYHGPASHVGHPRGMVSTHNAAGESIVLVWLSGDAILEINVDTGEYQEHPNPHFSGGPFASILSSDNVYYTLRDRRFVRFDPEKGGETELIAETIGRNASSMIEDDEGVIWAGVATEGALIRYDPSTGEFRDFGVMHEREHRVSPRFLAADDQGWIYMAFGGPTQILMIDRETGEATPVLEEDEREDASNRLWRATDGKVYSPGAGGQWLELHGGEVTRHNHVPEFERVYGTYKSPMRAHFVSGTQGLRHGDLPNGERVVELDMANRLLTLENPDTGDTRVLEFDYEGGDRSLVMTVEATSVGTIAGGTTYPARFFSYHPDTDQWTRGDIYRQWNATATTEDGVFYAGLYTEGVMLEWDPREPWVATERGNPDSNPLYLEQTRAHPHLWRPRTLLVYPGDRYVINSGTSSPGAFGGGLAIWDRQTRTAEILTHDDLVRYHNAFSIAALPEHRLLVGTSTGMRGGEERATGNARLYVLNLETKEIEWQKEAPDYQEGAYRGMTAGPVGPDGLVFIITCRRPPHRLLAFDPAERAVVHEQEVPEAFGMAASRSPRFIEIDDGRIFSFFHNVIAELDPATYELTERATLPAGGLVYPGAYLDGRLYFAAERSHIYSWEVPPSP